MTIRIDPEFRDLIPPLTDDERQQLEANIVRDGCRDPLVHWEGILVDGHHRFEICNRHHIAYRTASLNVETRREAKLWAIENQVGRRNLNNANLADLAHRYKELVAEPAAKERRAATLRRGEESPECETFHERGRASDDAAEKFGISGRTLDKWEDVLESEDEETIAAARRGEISVSKAHNIVKADHQLINQSNSNEWYTPAEYIEAARRVMGGIDLDPASSEMANKTVGATRFFTKKDDGLSMEWGGRVWLNPPYGKDGRVSNQKKWSERLIEDYEAGRVTEACLLVNAATSNSWFDPLWDRLLCFPRRRTNFWSPENPDGTGATHGSAVVYFGDNAEAFVREFSRLGAVVALYQPRSAA